MSDRPLKGTWFFWVIWCRSMLVNRLIEPTAPTLNGGNRQEQGYKRLPGTAHSIHNSISLHSASSEIHTVLFYISISVTLLTRRRAGFLSDQSSCNGLERWYLWWYRVQMCPVLRIGGAKGDRRNSETGWPDPFSGNAQNSQCTNIRDAAVIGTSVLVLITRDNRKTIDKERERQRESAYDEIEKTQ